MKKHYLVSFLIALSLLTGGGTASAETITLTTYYPSPSGAYDRLRLVPRDLIVGACDPGLLYYWEDNHILVCDNNGAYSPLSPWIQNGTYVYLATEMPIGEEQLRVGIGTQNPPFRLSLDTDAATPDGGIWAEGTSGTGAAVGNPGAGTRMLWYPAQAAFRAGSIDGAQWDEDNIGNNSVAFGSSPTAWGPASMAVGVHTTANGGGSTALGNATIANGNASLATGAGSTANGDFSTAMGSGSTADGIASTALGVNTVASGRASFAAGEQSLAMSNYTTAIGFQAVASGPYNTAIGIGASATTAGPNAYATALGHQTVASAHQATAIGANTVASGIQSTAMGISTTASGPQSTTMGMNTTANGHVSTAIGFGTNAQAFASAVVGSYNVALGTPGAWVADEPIFVVGNGFDEANRSNALTVLKNGNTGINVSKPEFDLHISSAMKLDARSSPPSACPAAHLGALYVDDSGALCFCDGAATWHVVAGSVGSTCN